MEHVQLRTMLALTLAGLSLGAVMWFWEPAEELEDPDATEAVWTIDADAVTRVEIRRRDDTVIVSREAEEWRVEAPWTGAADPDVVHDLLDALSEVERGVPVDGATDLAEFGLADPPIAIVEVTLSDGGVKTATFGDEAPIGYRTYALSEAGAVVAVGGRPGRSLLAKTSDFKDRRIFHVDPASVRAVSIESAEGRLAVRGEKTTWWLEGFTRADPDRVDDLIMGLLNIRIDEFLDLSDTITEPAVVVQVETESGEVSTVKVGDPTPLGVLVEYEDGFGTVYAESLRLLVQGPTDIGDRQAFPIDDDSVVRVSIAKGSQTWRAERAGPSWTVDGADNPAAQDSIDAVAEAVIHYRKQPVPPLTETWATVEIEARGEVIAIDLGQHEGEDFRVARDRAGGEPYLIPVVDLGGLPILGG